MSVTATSLLDQYALKNTATKKNDRTNLGQEDFLMLMMTQLKNQDPMKPMENGEFLGQMAQFSAVKGINDLQGSFAKLSESLSGNQTLQATNLIGKSVLTAGGETRLAAGGKIAGAVELTSSASTTINVYNSAGTLVRKIPLGMKAAGLVDFTWDGRTQSGAQAPAGGYVLKAETKDAKGQAIEVPVLLSTRINSVDLANGKVQVNTEDGRSIALSAVRQIRA